MSRDLENARLQGRPQPRQVRANVGVPKIVGTLEGAGALLREMIAFIRGFPGVWFATGPGSRGLVLAKRAGVSQVTRAAAVKTSPLRVCPASFSCRGDRITSL